jgi:ribonuclease inhibitor
MKRIVIDFRDCQNIEEVKGLFKEKLGISDLDNPDILYRSLRELEKCQIRIKGVNLVPAGLSAYIQKIVDILDEIEELHGNIDIRLINVVTIDFTGVKTVNEAHDIISNALDFPDWYGRNLSALWDLLTGYIAPYEIYIKGISLAHKDLAEYIEKRIKIFLDAEKQYNYIEVKIIEE